MWVRLPPHQLVVLAFLDSQQHDGPGFQGWWPGVVAPSASAGGAFRLPGGSTLCYHGAMANPTATPKSRIPQSFRLSLEAQKILARLAKKNGVTKTAVLEMALRDAGRKKD